MRTKNLLGRFTSQKSNLLTHRGEQSVSDLDEAPDLVEPVVGWRVWKVWTPLPGSDACPTLGSVILDMPWVPRRKIAAEHSFDLGEKCRGILESDCSCGIYAFKHPADAFTYLMKVRDRQLGMSVEVALGTVSLWGKVIECERGFKGQFAYPRHIYLPVTISRFVAKVSSAFGVAVGVYVPMFNGQPGLAVSPGDGGKDSQMLQLENHDRFWFENIPIEVGFYGLMASAGPADLMCSQPPAIRFTASEADERGEGGCRP